MKLGKKRIFNYIFMEAIQLAPICVRNMGSVRVWLFNSCTCTQSYCILYNHVFAERISGQRFSVASTVNTKWGMLVTRCSTKAWTEARAQELTVALWATTIDKCRYKNKHGRYTLMNDSQYVDQWQTSPLTSPWPGIMQYSLYPCSVKDVL